MVIDGCLFVFNFLIVVRIEVDWEIEWVVGVVLFFVGGGRCVLVVVGMGMISKGL